jgi:hypothetical protein
LLITWVGLAKRAAQRSHPLPETSPELRPDQGVPSEPLSSSH